MLKTYVKITFFNYFSKILSFVKTIIGLLDMKEPKSFSDIGAVSQNTKFPTFTCLKKKG